MDPVYKMQFLDERVNVCLRDQTVKDTYINTQLFLQKAISWQKLYEC